MRILLIHNFYRQQGGEDLCFAEEAALLRERGHKVDLYTRHNDEVQNLNRFELAKMTIWNANTYTEIAKKLRSTSYDIIHVHNILPLISPSIFYAARMVGVPSVQTLHNFRLACANGFFFRNGRICERCLSERIPHSGIRFRCYRNSRLQTAGVAAMTSLHRMFGTWSEKVDTFIALTAFAREKMIAGGLDPDQVFIKPNFIDQMPDAGSGSGGYAIFVGRLAPEKGVLTMLEAWNDLADVMPLKIVGDGPLANTVKERAAHSGAIEWLGHVDKEGVRTLMRDAAILVFPSEWYETFGRVAIEAMSVGTPVVASNLGAMKEIVEQDKSGRLFEPGNVESLRSSVRWAASHPERLREMRITARETVESKFCADRNYELLMEVYNTTIDRAQRHNRTRSNQRRFLVPPIA